ncbi:MAG: transposase [Hyphomicrobium sp.]
MGAFDGGVITSHGGALLLGVADRSIRLTERLAGSFRDLRLAKGITHTLADLLRQRIFLGIALGYEDLIDYDQLRFDPALTAVMDKPCGRLAGTSTLNRLEHAGKIGQNRHH